MTDTLFEIEPTVPRWKDLADVHGISCTLREPHYLPPAYVAELEWFGKTETEQGETAREAIRNLMFKLGIDGHEEISL